MSPGTLQRLLPLLLCLLPGIARSACPIERPIRVSFYDLGVDYDPHSGHGLDSDIVDELQRRTGCRFSRTYDSRVRIWSQMAAGALDMTVSGVPTPERERSARFVVYAWERDILLARNAAGLPPSPEAFLADPDLLVGVVKSYRYADGWNQWLQALRERHRVREVPDVETLFKVLDAGRVAAVPLEPEAVTLIGSRYRLTHPVRRLNWFGDRPRLPVGLVLSRTRLPAGLSDLLAAQIRLMQKDGTLLEIFRRYYPDEDARNALTPP